MRYEIKKRTSHHLTTFLLIDHEAKIETEIIPSIGNNLISFRQNEYLFISEPPSISQLKNSHNYYKYGSAILFPPNRIKNATYEYKGRKYNLIKNEDPNHLHGELCARAWKVINEGVSDDNGCYIVSEFSIQDHEDIYNYFPHDLTFQTTYHLINGKLEVSGKVKNNGLEEAPYALGFHPYFEIPKGMERDVELSVPALEEWPVTIEAFVEDLPKKTTFIDQLKNGISVDHFDDLFCSLITLEKTNSLQCSLHYKNINKHLIYELAPKHFPFLVIFKPDWSSAISLEPYTYVTDAFNLPWKFEQTGGKGIKPKEEILFQWKLFTEKN